MNTSALRTGAVALLTIAAVARADVSPGMTLDQTTAEQAKDLLPPEILSHYTKGEYVNRIVEFPESKFQWDDGWDEATGWNREHLSLDEHKSPIDKETGKRPEYITGYPFPDIREDDPDAGVKILWNTVYAVYNRGNSHNLTQLDWVSPTGIDRSSGQDGWFLYYDGQPRHYVPKENPDNLLLQLLAVTTSPTDLQGTAALSWRYKDPEKRDASWAYVPALRRVRSVSPANRSDGFLGSDMAQDDGYFFDGKPEDFEWKLVGHRDALRLTDPDAIDGKIVPKALPGGGWRVPFTNNERTAGYQVKGWKGVAWAPVAAALTKSKVWVIEGRPKDKYYLYGRIELWIDDHTYQGAWNRKFSWKGELLNTFQVATGMSVPFNDEERQWATTFGWQCAENVKANRATIGGISPPGDVPEDRRMVLDPALFSYNTLNRFGK